MALGALDVLWGHLTQVRYFAGSSVGALLTAALAMGQRPSEVLDRARTISWTPNPDLDVLYRDFGMDDVRGVVQGVLGATSETFAALRRRTGKDLVICATNVTKQRPEYFSADSHPDVAVVDAVCASCSIPVLYTPVKIGGDLFVDGAVTDAFPLGALKRKTSARTLGITFVETRCREVTDALDFIHRVFECCLTNSEHSQRTDILRLDVTGVGILPWDTMPIDDLVHKGRVQGQAFSKKQV